LRFVSILSFIFRFSFSFSFSFILKVSAEDRLGILAAIPVEVSGIAEATEFVGSQLSQNVQDGSATGLGVVVGD